MWDITKRIIQGKPAFEAPPQDDTWEDNEPTTDFAEDRQLKAQKAEAKSLIDDKGYKHIPVAAATNVKSTQNGNHIELWVTITNQSDRDLRLDKMTLLGTRFELNYPLSVGAQRVFRVYSGPQMSNDSYKKAELYYQDVQTNDYFRADHLVDYRYESDGTYDVNDFNLILPIRDV